MSYMDLFDRALGHAKRGQFEEAKDIFEELIKETPEDSDLLYNLGMCHTELGEPTKAIELLKLSIKYNPTFSNAYVALGVAYSKLGDLKNARGFRLTAIRAPPFKYALNRDGPNFGVFVFLRNLKINNLYYFGSPSIFVF